MAADDGGLPGLFSLAFGPARLHVSFGLSRKVLVAYGVNENPMNTERIPKTCWRPVVAGVLGCILGAALGCVAGFLLCGLYAATFSQAEFKHRYGDMVGVAMILWAIRGIPVGAVVLGALAVWREIRLSRAGKRTS